jgi:hypothetical protein
VYIFFSICNLLSWHHLINRTAGLLYLSPHRTGTSNLIHLLTNSILDTCIKFQPPIHHIGRMVAVERGVSSPRRKFHTKLPLFFYLINCITITSIPNVKIESLVNSNHTNNWIAFQNAEIRNCSGNISKTRPKVFNFFYYGQRIDHLFCYRPRILILLLRLQSLNSSTTADSSIIIHFYNVFRNSISHHTVSLSTEEFRNFVIS